ncbi:MAG TPA: nickel pincer cofactor biosynthesis protein LarC [Thermodesulfovibrionales bacterium]|nr:nickel pincer cofactor biosynthesis protein LarC [Thermodesulfovibrionales bacterium]
MKVAYFDCFSGISGDMCLGAIVDAGVPLKALEKELKKIPITGYRLSMKKVERGHLKACKVSVVIKPGLEVQAGKTWKDVRKIIQDSSLPQDMKQKGLSVFKTIFEAEAKVHGGNFQTVHLHELGAVDCMIDVFGTIIGLNLLGVKRMLSSPVNLGSGFVKTETGVLPVPAPATAEILKNVPVYSHYVHTELTTPTGAAIIKELSSGHGDMPLMDIEKIGVGAGDNDFRHWPNVLRIFIGTSQSPTPVRDKTTIPEGKVIVIETNIDDMIPQVFEHVIDLLYKAGSLDVYLTQVIMKKGRPGVKLTALCYEERKEALMKIILRETSSIGLRYYETRRRVMQREIKTVDTKFGKIRVKVSKLGNEIIKAAPEYEDCRKIARQFNIPLIEVMKIILDKNSP